MTAPCASLTTPLVAPVVARAFSAHEEAPSPTVYEPEFLVGLLRSPARVVRGDVYCSRLCQYSS